MSNRVRHYLKEEVTAFTPKLQACYRLVGKFQKQRTELNEKALLDSLNQICAEIQIFKPHIQYLKQPYFDAVGNQSLGISDRIIALDIAVGAMHIEFPISRSYSHQESEELRNIIASTRADVSDDLYIPADGDGVLSGIPASEGTFAGKVRLVTRSSEYRRLPKNTVVVTKMTRPEFILGSENIKAIVTDQGGRLCHAAVIARELGIPCVVGTQHATSVLKSSQLVTVNGSEGTVEPVKR